MENHLKIIRSWDYAGIVLEVWIKRNFEKKVKVSIQEVVTEVEAETTTHTDSEVASVEGKRKKMAFGINFVSGSVINCVVVLFPLILSFE